MLKSVTKRLDAEGFAKSAAKSRIEIPEGEYTLCPACKVHIFCEECEKNLKVCPKCTHHFRLSARERILITVDEGSFEEWDADMTSLDPIGFDDYQAKLEKLKLQTCLNEAVITGKATIGGYRCVIAVMDSRFLMGSMGSVVGEKITRCFERATDAALPVVIFATSGGARMHEGIIALMQMAKTAGAVAVHSAAGLLYVTVLTDPTTGGVLASFASLGDIIMAEPRALIGFAGRRVVEATIKQKLPENFQSAEFMQAHGFVDLVVARAKMKTALTSVLALHDAPKGGAAQ